MNPAPVFAPQASLPPPRVGAVVVSYHPEPELLSALLRALSPQVAQIVVVDNGSPREQLAAAQGAPSLLAADPQNVQWQLLGDNLGIAAAHNRGLAPLLAQGMDFVLLFDQDSEPRPDMVAQLLAAHRHLTAAGQRVGALGPVPVDRVQGRWGHFVRMVRGWPRQIHARAGQDALAVDFLISSGCLLPAPVLADVGLMNEGLFIDHVDTEWCFRAMARGWRLFAIPPAQLLHALGEHTVRIWLGRWRHVPVHSPLRGYYILRNTLLMLRTCPMSWAWRLGHLLRLAQFLVFFSLGPRPRRLRFRMMALGLLHGLAGRSGPYPG